MYTAQDIANPIIRVTSKQFITLKAVQKGEVVGITTPCTRRIIGANSNVLNTLLERGWVEKIFINPNTDAYALTTLGHKALCRLSETKREAGGYRAIFL